MTLRAILGLVALNLSFAFVGSAVLWGMRGSWRWAEALRLVGLAYILGVACVTTALTVQLIVGVPFGWASVVTTGVAIGLVGCLIGWMRSGDVAEPTGSSARGYELVFWVSVAWVAALAVYFEALFRAARLHPTGEWDALWVWTIRAKALAFFGDLGGSELVRGSMSDYESYPPIVSLLQAMGFLAMGSVDSVTLHLQNWFLVLGFVLALIGILSPYVRAAFLLPFIALCISIPGFSTPALFLYADALLAFFAALAAILLVLWIDDRSTWRIAVVVVLMSGVLLTKRDGILVVACLTGAAVVASFRDRGWAWPRLAAATGIAVVASLPWWIGARGLTNADPSSGPLGFVTEYDRLRPAIQLVISTFLDDGLWLGLTWLVIASVTLGLVSGGKDLAVFLASYLFLSLFGLALVIAAEPLFEATRDPGLNPVERLVMVPTIVAASITPILLERAWRRWSASTAHALTQPPATPSVVGRVLPTALVAMAALLYIGSVLQGS